MKNRIFFLGAMILAIVVFFSGKQHAKILPFYYDQEVSVVGTVREVIPKFTNTRVIVDTEKLSYIDIPIPSHERVLVTLAPGVTLVPTDRVTIYGKLEQPENFVTDTGTEFDYKVYLQTNHIYATMHIPSVTIIGHSSGMFAMLERALYHTRESIRNHIRSIFPLPVSALYGGIMIGDQSLFPPELLDVFRKSGLIHIMVLSGSNIALVAGFVFIWARKLGYYRRYIITGVIVILFVMMTGFAPPSVRALVMILVTYGARLLIRGYSGAYVLLLTVLVMLLINPALARNISFHLSILATYAIMFVAPLVQGKLTNITRQYGIREIVAQTLSAQIIVVPYTVVSMGMFSLVGIFLNIIVVPLTGFLTVAGYTLTGFSYISTQLASMLALPFAYLASMIIAISELFVKLPYAFIHTAGLGTEVLAIYYLLLLIIGRNYFIKT